jgi:hypothetical protein
MSVFLIKGQKNALTAVAIRADVENHLSLSKGKKDKASSGLLQWRGKPG